MSRTLGQAHAWRGHQRLMMELVVAINNNYEDVIVLTESNIKDGVKNSYVPDITIIDKKTKKDLIYIEICHKDGLEDDLDKVSDYIEEFDIEECFVIHYKEMGNLEYKLIEWYRVTAEGEEKGNSYCEVLEADLDELLNEE